MCTRTRTIAVSVLLCMPAFAAPPGHVPSQNPPPTDEANPEVNPFECGFQSRDVLLAELKAAIERGDVPDPRTRPLPEVKPRPGRPQRGVPVVTADDVFPYEDSAGLLLTNFSTTDLLLFMGQAANALMVEHGDNFDLAGFFVNFTPNHQIGSAFYFGLANDVSGIGLEIFQDRASWGVAGDRMQGMVMMWRVQAWAANDTAMLVLGQEFEHRFALFLDPLLDGRLLQGDDAGCGRSAHWNWKVDGQGSGMEIREWIGSSPATLGGDCAPGGFFFICRNSDIGGVFSYTDLYLMGYVSPAEMDAGNSELRYMNTSCSSPYSGAISTFDSDGIIAANGPRVPDSSAAQHDFRTGWIMLHQPGDPPAPAQLENAVAILNLWSTEWSFGTLGRGTMNNTLINPFTISFPDGTPTRVTPDTPTSFDVQTTNEEDAPDTDSGLLHYSIDGGPEQTTPLTFLGGDLFRATLPAVPCTSTIEFFVTIDALGGDTVRAPGGGTLGALSAFSVSTVFSDNFEVDLGWTVQNIDLSDGGWDRGVPVDCSRGDPPADFDGSGQCWLTDNSAASSCNSDVDGGPTQLTSPALDLSAPEEYRIRYARWFTNDDGDADRLDVEISNDDGASWVLVESVPGGVGWVEHSFAVDDFVAPTNQVRVRFSATDNPNNSVTEAAVDALKVLVVNCEPCLGDIDGSGAVDLGDLAILLSNFGTVGGVDPSDGDLNDDDRVDLGDLAILLSVFGTPCG